jgi:Trk K+ transport system NAD-binding subunit
MAKHLFGVPRTLCRIYDPIREEIYRGLGLETISPTVVGATLFKQTLDNPPAGGEIGNRKSEIGDGRGEPGNAE